MKMKRGGSYLGVIIHFIYGKGSEKSITNLKKSACLFWLAG